jgi:hypothetical protein
MCFHQESTHIHLSISPAEEIANVHNRFSNFGRSRQSEATWGTFTVNDNYSSLPATIKNH